MDRFERIYEEEYFRELARPQKKITIEAYVEEFQKILVMVTNISDRRIKFLFIEGLLEHLRGLITYHEPSTF